MKLNQKLQSNFDRIPHGVSTPLIKARTIDDVPILALTIHSPHYDHLTLRRLAAQVDAAEQWYSEAIQRHHLYVAENGDDLPEIKNWRWSQC